MRLVSGAIMDFSDSMLRSKCEILCYWSRAAYIKLERILQVGGEIRFVEVVFEGELLETLFEHGLDLELE